MTRAEKRTLPLAELKAGMRLAEDLLDSHGSTLMRAGSALSEKQLNSLHQRGFDQVAVFIQPVLTEAERAEQVALIERRLAAQFDRFQDQPVMVELAELMRRYHLQGLD